MTNQPTTYGPAEWTPDHYRGDGLQPFDVVDAFGLDFYEGNAIKYLLRWRKKNGAEDLRKARTYVQILIDRAEQARVDEPGVHSVFFVHHTAKTQVSGSDGVDEKAPEPGTSRPLDGETTCDAYETHATPADSGLCARCGMYDWKHQPTAAVDDAPARLRKDLVAVLADYPVAAWTPSNIAGRVLRVMQPELDQLRATEAAITRTRELHRKANNGDTCVYCAPGQRLGYDTTWPCDTIRALDGTPDPAKG